MKKAAFPVLVLVLVACALAGCGSSEPDTSYSPRELKAFVQDAYDYVQANGKEKALEEFMNTGGRFARGEVYIFAYTTDGTVISHGGDPTLVGKNIITYKDPNGILAVEEAARIAKTRGSGWLLCQFPNPTTKQQQDKLVYIKKVDENWFLGSGLYL